MSLVAMGIRLLLCFYYSINLLEYPLCYTGCHLGRDKTVEKVSGRFFWRNMNADIREFVQQCDKCQRMNPKFSKAAASYTPSDTSETSSLESGVKML